MLPNELYTVFVEGTRDGDRRAVKDKGGTPMASDYHFSFTTTSGCSIC
jgi:ketosteroid isomerase-like protein